MHDVGPFPPILPLSWTETEDLRAKNMSSAFKAIRLDLTSLNRSFRVPKLRYYNKIRLQTLEWCLDLGVTMVTVYAFSIENFKRSQSEVDALMELAKSGFTELMQQTFATFSDWSLSNSYRGLIHEHGVCVRFLGDLTLLPPDVQECIAQCMNLSRNNKKLALFGTSLANSLAQGCFECLFLVHFKGRNCASWQGHCPWRRVWNVIS